jgi:hypothetical protein
MRLDAVRRHASSSVSAASAQVATAVRGAGSFAVDEVSEGVGEPHLRRPDRALRRGAQQPRLGRLGQPRQRTAQVRERVVGRQVVLEVGEQLGELDGKSSGASWRRSRWSA